MVELQELYMRRPPLYEALALDRAVTVFEEGDKRHLAVVGSKEGAVEFIKRYRNACDMLGFGAFDPLDFVDDARRWGAQKITPIESISDQMEYSTALWLEPNRESVDEVLGGISRQVAASGRVVLLMRGVSYRIFDRKRQKLSDSEEHIDPAEMLSKLVSMGWRIQSRLGFHSLRSQLFLGLSLVARLLRMRLLEDKLLHTARESYVTSYWNWLLSPIVMVVAER